MTASVNNKDPNGWTPLHLAVNNHQLKLAEFLILRGAGIDDKTNNLQTPIHISCENEDLDLFILLFNSRASLFSQDIEGNTPLHILSRNQSIHIITWLQKNYDLKYLLNIKNHNFQVPSQMSNNIHIHDILSVKKMNYRINESNNMNKVQSSLDKMNPSKIPKPLGDELEEEEEEFENNLSISSESSKNEIIKNIDNHQTMNFFKKQKVSPNCFSPIKQIGHGSFGNVYLVQEKRTQKFFAMKMLDKQKLISQNLIKYAITEKNVLSNINHPFIVKLYYSFQTNSKLFLVLDYCPNGDLSQIILKERRLTEESARLYLCEILLALSALHRNDIIYRDLKPDNIVLDKDGHALLTDFGLSKEGVFDNVSAKSFCGSIAYLAPEMIKKSGHGKSVDWYLFGVLMYEMIVGTPPYFNKDKDTLFENITDGILQIPSNMSNSAKSLILSVFLN